VPLHRGAAADAATAAADDADDADDADVATPDPHNFKFKDVDAVAFVRIWRAVLRNSEANEELLYNSFCFLDIDQSGGLVRLYKCVVLFNLFLPPDAAS
jgi:hypothetical protein